MATHSIIIIMRRNTSFPNHSRSPHKATHHIDAFNDGIFYRNILDYIAAQYQAVADIGTSQRSDSRTALDIRVLNNKVLNSAKQDPEEPTIIQFTIDIKSANRMSATVQIQSGRIGGIAGDFPCILGGVLGPIFGIALVQDDVCV